MPDLESVIASAASEAGIFSASSESSSEPVATETTAAQPDATTSTPAATETAATSPTTTAQTAAAEASATADETELATIEKEIVDKTPNLADPNARIQVSRHQAVLTRQRRQAEAEQAKLHAEIAQYKTKYDQHADERIAAAQLAERNPEVFVKHVLLNDPRYVGVIEGLVNEAISKRGASAAVPAPGAYPTEKPKPDTVMPDGSLGYSAEAAEKLSLYVAGQVKAEVDKALAERDKGLKPVLDREKAIENYNAAYERQGKILKNARESWPDFVEHEKDIRAELGKPGNERMDLFTAYTRVVPAKLKERATLTDTERAKIARAEREKLEKEINAASRTSTAQRPGQMPAAKAAGEGEPRSLDDVVRDAGRKAGILR
jgi:hypothetical protein